MKVIFIESEILPREKLLKLIFCEKKERDLSSYPHLITLDDTQFTTEKILQELKVSKELIDEIMRSDVDDKLLIILNDGVKFEGQTDQLNFDFKKSGNMKYKNFNVHLDQEEVYINDKRIKLTVLEYRLLLFFLYNVKKLISRQEIINYLWGQSKKPLAYEVTMYTHIKNIKKKIIKSGIGNFIHSIYGQGYKFEDPDDVIL